MVLLKMKKGILFVFLALLLLLSPQFIFKAKADTPQYTITDLGTLPGNTSSQAMDINDKGQVVGQSWGSSGSYAFLWQNGTMTQLPVSASASSSIAFGINNNGQITGQIQYPDRPDAVIWDNGNITDLSTSLLGEGGNDINKNKVIV